MTNLLTISLSLSFVALSAQASVFDINSDSSDQEYRVDGSSAWDGNSTARIGTDDAGGSAYVMVFALPTLTAGEAISNANLDFYVNASSNLPSAANWNVDLYGVRTSNSSTVLSTDFFMGANDASATKLNDNIIAGLGNTAPTTGVHSTSILGDSALIAWLDSLYTGTSPIASYAFIRLNGDLAPADMNANSYVTVGTGNSNGLDVPVLQITSEVPEPSTYAALLGFSALGVAMLRRRCI